VVHTFLGIVERINVGKSGPGARLRPIFQASPDKTRWLTPEEDFPNSGVVSWWQPVPDAELYKAWIFQVERSWTYEYDNEHHDYYGVKGSPAPAVELIDLSAAADPEDTRSFLLKEGVPLERCASKRLVFRDRNGSVVGPLELSLRDGRLFWDEKEALVPVNDSNGELALGAWEDHQFLPLEVWPQRGGEVDYSPNSVFLKRILREIREMTPQVIDNAMLTERLIGSYCTALEKMSLTPLQSQRLKRLHTLAAKSHLGVTLAEDAVPDLLSLSAVKDLLAAAKEQAGRSAVEERRVTLNELDRERADLENEVTTLRTEAARWRDEIESSRQEETALFKGFDERLKKKFEAIGKDASSFLTDIAVVRAALSGPGRNRAFVIDTMVPPKLGEVQSLGAGQIASSFREHFDNAGLGCVLPITLLSSWASGYAPMAFGVMARDAFVASGDSLFGGRLHVSTLGPSLSLPTDLLRLPTSSSLGLGTVEELLSEAAHSEDLFLLVFENINLCQLDSSLVPLLRNYAAIQGHKSTSRSPVTYATPAGLWSSNVFIGGIMIDSPLGLPMSRELWTCSTFIDAGARRVCAKGKGAEGPSSTSKVSYAAWIEWLQTIDWTRTSDARLLAAHVAREVETSSTSKRLLHRLAAALDQTSPGVDESSMAGLLAEMAVIPYSISRGISPDAAMKDSPAQVSLENGFVDTMTGLFEKWGLELR
jgi:hypothetical protein